MAQEIAENRALTTSFTLDSRLLPLLKASTEVVGGVCRDIWRPVPVPEESRHAAVRAVTDLDRELQPANREWIAARVMTLLSHFYTPEMPEQLQRAVASDWVSVLGGYPRWAIERACIGYLARDTNKRPTPGQIADMADGELSEKRLARDRLKACLEHDVAKPKKARKGTVTMAEALQACEAAKAALRQSVAEDEKERRANSRR